MIQSVTLNITRWVASMILLGKFVGGGVVDGGADTNYLYPARWGWINSSLGLYQYFHANTIVRNFHDKPIGDNSFLTILIEF